MIRKNEVLRQALQRETLKYYESYTYNSTISEAILEYEKSGKTTEDENKVIETFEFHTMKKVYASACLDMMATDENMPSTLKIMDLLLCVEEIALSRYEKLEDQTSQYVESPDKFDQNKFEEALDEYEVFFERVADCMLRIVMPYKGWHQSHLSWILLKYMMYHSRSVRVDLKIHQMMRNILGQMNIDDELGSLQQTTASPLLKAVATFKTFAELIRVGLHLVQFDATKFIQKIAKARKEKSLKEFLQDLNSVLAYMPNAQIYQGNIQKYNEIFDDKDLQKKNFKLTCTWLWKEIFPTNDSSDEVINNSGIHELIGYFKLLQLILNEEISPEGIMSLMYTEYTIAGIFDFYVMSGGQNMEAMPAIRNACVLEMKRAILCSQDPKSLVSTDFALLVEGIVGVYCLNTFHFAYLTHPAAQQYNLTFFVKHFLDTMFSPYTNQLVILLWNIRRTHKEVKTTKSGSKLVWNAPESIYYVHLIALLQIIDEFQMTKVMVVQQGNINNIVSRYEYVRPELLKLLEEEYLDALNSGLESYGMIYWSKFILYEFKWKMAAQDVQGFCRAAIRIFENIIEKIFNLEKMVTPALKESLNTDPSREKYVLLNLHSLIVTNIIMIICSNEFAESGLKEKIVNTLQLDTVLKFFDEMRAKVSPKEDELTFKVACYYYGFYFGVCSYIQGSRLTKNKEDLILTIPQFEKLMELAVLYTHPGLLFSDVLSQLPTQITNAGKNRADYLRSLHASGFMEYLCREVYFDFNTGELVQMDTQPDIVSYEEVKFETFKTYLYDQMIEDKNYAQVNKVISIYREKVIEGEKIVKSRLFKFQEIHDVEKYRCVSDFWLYSLDVKSFIQALDDLFAQAKTKGFENEPEAQGLMKTLQESLITVLEVFTSLPLVSRDPAIAKFLINLLNHVNTENQMECLKIIRTAVLSHLNPENHTLVATKYQAISQTTTSKKEFKLSEFLIEIIYGKTQSKDLLNYFQLESLVSFFEALDYSLSLKLTNKIKDSKLLAEDLQTLLKLWNSFHTDANLLATSGKNIQKVANKLSQHYFSFFNLCYDGATETISKILLENLDQAVKRSKDSTQRETSLMEVSEALFTATALIMNFIQHYTQQTGAGSLTKELGTIIRGFLSKKGFMSLVMEAIASLEELNGHLFKQVSGKDQKVEEKAAKAALIQILSAKNEIKAFFDTLDNKQVLKEGFIRSLFPDTDEHSQMSQLRATFFQELLEGTAHLVQLNTETQDLASDKDIAAVHQQEIDSVLKFETELMNLVFFSTVENPLKQEMIDYFYQKIFLSLLKFSKSVPSADARKSCTLLAKFSTLKQEALEVIFTEIDTYKKSFEMLANMEATALRAMVKSEMSATESKTPDTTKNFTDIICALVRNYNQIAGILNSNMEALVDRSSSLAEINITISNRLFECLQGFNAEELHTFLKKRLSESDYKSLCKFAFEAVSNSSSIFQKILKNDEPVKIKKAVNELYLLCVLLLKPGNKLDIYTMTNADQETVVLMNLFAIFEHSPENFEQFLSENPEIMTWIVQEAENSERGYWLLHILIKTLALDSDIKDTILMHTVSQGIMKVDRTTLAGDFNNNFFNVFYHDLFEKIQKEILMPDDDGKVKLSVSSPAMKDLPCIDPDKLTLSKRGNSLLKNFLRAIELSASRPQQLKGLITILSYLIPHHPHIVILLSKMTFQHISPTVKRSLLVLQLHKKAASGPKNKKLSFLDYLLQTCLYNSQDRLLSVLINALIEPQTQSQLILFNKKLVPTATYHRHLVAKWINETLENMTSHGTALSDTTLQVLVIALRILFREVHLLSRDELELYYQVCSKCFDLHRVLVRLPDNQKIAKSNIMLGCLVPFKMLSIADICTEYFDESYPELLFNFNPMIYGGVREYFFKYQSAQAILQFTNKPEDQEKALNSTPKLNSIGKNVSEATSGLIANIYNMSKIVFGAKSFKNRASHLIDLQKFNLPTFDKETRAILSKLPNNALNFNDLKLTEGNVLSQPCESAPIFEKLMEQIQSYSRLQAKVLRSDPLTTDLKLEDFLTGTNPQEELAELARIVKAKFRKTFEPILEQKFESILHSRKILSSFKSSETEKELMDFLNKLTRKEYIAFLLFADEEVFNKQPKHIQTILLGLKAKAKALLADKAFYPQAEDSNQANIVDSKVSGEKTRIERLIAFDSKAKNSNLLDELESQLLGRIDCNTTLTVFKQPENPSAVLQKLDADRRTQFFRQLYNILDEYMSKKNANVRKHQGQRILPLSADLLERLILPLLILNQSSDYISNKLKDSLTNAVDIVRWFDLSLLIISFPDDKLTDFKNVLKNHFKFDPVLNLSMRSIKEIINYCLVTISVDCMIEPLCLGSFEVFIKKIESELGVLPLKQKLLQIAKMDYEKDKTFIQLWLSTYSKNSKSNASYNGKVLFTALVELARHLDSTETDSSYVEALLNEYLTLMDDAKYFHFSNCKLNDVNMFFAAKNPRVFELLLESCGSSINTSRLKSLKEVTDKLHAGIKSVHVTPTTGKFSLKAQESLLKVHEEFCQYMAVMYSTLIRFILEVVERLSNPSVYTKAQRNSLVNFNGLLKQFLSNPTMLQLFSVTAGNLELIEEKTDGSPDSITLQFINSSCSYILLFYRLTQAQEELDYALSLGQEAPSPALLRIKSKTHSVTQEKQATFMSLDRSISSISSESPLSPDEIVFRLSSKCNKVFKSYVNMERESYTAMTMVPWVIPQSIRLQFIRDKLAKTETTKIRKFYLRRKTILEDTLFNFDSLDSIEINPELKLNIEFVGEAGVDQGGLTTEWASQVLNILCDPSYGLFHHSSNNISLQPSPTSAIIPSNHKYYRLVGRIVGYVIANGISVSVNFTKPMIKQLLGVPLTQHDLNDVDPDLSNSLQWMLENHLNAEELNHEFSFEFRFLDNYYTIDLNEELTNQKVDEDNKKLFVKQLIYHKLSKCIEVPLAEIKAGITEFVPSVLLKLLTPHDLHSLLAGESTIDVEEMKKYVKMGPIAPSDEVVNWFWEIVKELEKDQLSALLFFMTGNSIVGYGGFKEHPITLNRSFQSIGSLPLAHTCFSTIDLPDYPSKEVMKEKLLKAILEGQGFHLA